MKKFNGISEERKLSDRAEAQQRRMMEAKVYSSLDSTPCLGLFGPPVQVSRPNDPTRLFLSKTFGSYEAANLNASEVFANFSPVTPTTGPVLENPLAVFARRARARDPSERPSGYDMVPGKANGFVGHGPQSMSDQFARHPYEDNPRDGQHNLEPHGILSGGGGSPHGSHLQSLTKQTVSNKPNCTVGSSTSTNGSSTNSGITRSHISSVDIRSQDKIGAVNGGKLFAASRNFVPFGSRESSSGNTGSLHVSVTSVETSLGFKSRSNGHVDPRHGAGLQKLEPSHGWTIPMSSPKLSGCDPIGRTSHSLTATPNGLSVNGKSETGNRNAGLTKKLTLNVPLKQNCEDFLAEIQQEVDVPPLLTGIITPKKSDGWRFPFQNVPSILSNNISLMVPKDEGNEDQRRQFASSAAVLPLEPCLGSKCDNGESKRNDRIDDSVKDDLQLSSSDGSDSEEDLANHGIERKAAKKPVVSQKPAMTVDASTAPSASSAIPASAVNKDITINNGRHVSEGLAVSSSESEDGSDDESTEDSSSSDNDEQEAAVATAAVASTHVDVKQHEEEEQNKTKRWAMEHFLPKTSFLENLTSSVNKVDPLVPVTKYDTDDDDDPFDHVPLFLDNCQVPLLAVDQHHPSQILSNLDDAADGTALYPGIDLDHDLHPNAFVDSDLQSSRPVPCVATICEPKVSAVLPTQMSSVVQTSARKEALAPLPGVTYSCGKPSIVVCIKRSNIWKYSNVNGGTSSGEARGAVCESGLTGTKLIKSTSVTVGNLTPCNGVVSGTNASDCPSQNSGPRTSVSPDAISCGSRRNGKLHLKKESSLVNSSKSKSGSISASAARQSAESDKRSVETEPLQSACRVDKRPLVDATKASSSSKRKSCSSDVEPAAKRQCNGLAKSASNCEQSARPTEKRSDRNDHEAKHSSPNQHISNGHVGRQEARNPPQATSLPPQRSKAKNSLKTSRDGSDGDGEKLLKRSKPGDGEKERKAPALAASESVSTSHAKGTKSSASGAVVPNHTVDGLNQKLENGIKMPCHVDQIHRPLDRRKGTTASYREKPTAEPERLQSADYYLQEARRLKREGSGMKSDSLLKLMTYADSLLAFVCHCYALEQEHPEAPRTFKMYQDTLKFSQYVCDARNVDTIASKLKYNILVVSLRLQSLICSKLYRRNEAAKLKSVLDEFHKNASKPMQIPSPYQSNGLTGGAGSWSHPNGTPSPLSPRPTPSPAGSVGSVGSAGSGNGDCYVGKALTNGSSNSSVVLPQRIHSVTMTYLSHVNYLYLCHDSWDQAMTIFSAHPDVGRFFEDMDDEFGPIDLHSSISAISNYVSRAIRRIRLTSDVSR